MTATDAVVWERPWWSTSPTAGRWGDEWFGYLDVIFLGGWGD